MRKTPDSKRWRLVADMERSGKFNDNIDVIQTDEDAQGWGIFSDEIGLFISDFFKRRLSAEEKLIFYSYYVTGMNLDEISERFYNNRELSKFSSEEECDDDDINIKHDSHQAVHKKVLKINSMLRHAWQYSDRWREI